MDRRRFLTRTALSAAAASLASAPATAEKPKEKKEGRWNVVLVTVDDMKATALACYGNPWIQSPSTDRLAEEGSTFERAYTQFPKCVPCRASLLTGRYPHVEGHRTLPGFMLRPEEPDLARLLRSHGYHTGHIGKNHTANPDHLAEMFDEVPSLHHGRGGRLLGKPKENDPMFRAFYRGKWIPKRSLEDHSEVRIAEAARDFIRRNRSRRFFLMVNFHLPHTPYIEYSPWAE